MTVHGCRKMYGRQLEIYQIIMKAEKYRPNEEKPAE